MAIEGAGIANVQGAHRYTETEEPSEGISRSRCIEAVMAIPSKQL